MREATASLIKTIFGLATGRIRHDFGEVEAAANGLAAFNAIPEFVARGQFQKLQTDLTDRIDFKELSKHSNEGDVMEYVERLSADEVEFLADCAESFFTEVVRDEEAIPMASSEKRRLIEMMAKVH